MQKKQNTSLVWFRNDLRIHDNSSLANAIKSNNRVIALYCFDPRQFEVDQLGFKKTEKGKRRIDWILTQGRLKINRTEIVLFGESKQIPSDHQPVTALLWLE